MTDHHLDCQEFPHKVNLLNFTYIFWVLIETIWSYCCDQVTLGSCFRLNSSCWFHYGDKFIRISIISATPKMSFVRFANNFWKQNKYMPNSYSNLCILSELARAGFSDHVYSCGFSIIFVAAVKRIKSHCSLSSQNNNKSPRSHLGLIKGERIQSRRTPLYKRIILIADNQRKVTSARL